MLMTFLSAQIGAQATASAEAHVRGPTIGKVYPSGVWTHFMRYRATKKSSLPKQMVNNSF
jgi:hypothetical protein